MLQLCCKGSVNYAADYSDKRAKEYNRNFRPMPCKAEPVFVTKNGYGDLVVMSMETYERLIDSSNIDLAIKESEEEIANGAELLDARDALNTLRRKYIG